MSTELMVRHAQLAGLSGSGKAMAASLLSDPEWTPPSERGTDSRSHNPVVAANGTTARWKREVTG